MTPLIVFSGSAYTSCVIIFIGAVYHLVMQHGGVE